MPICRILLTLAALGGSVLAADLHVLPNETIQGELVAIDDKTVVMKTEAGVVTKPLMSVLHLDLQPLPKIVPATYLQVALTDNTILHCKPAGFAFDGKKVQLTLLSEVKVEVPITSLLYILKDAHDPKVRDNQDWKDIFKGRKSHDLAVIALQGRLNGLGGTFTDGKGTRLNFVKEGRDTAVPIDLLNKNVQGCIFVNKLDPNAPATLCKLYDMFQSVIPVSRLEVKAGGNFLITTVGGATLAYPRGQVGRLDYTTSKRVYLSDLEGTLVEDPGADFPERYRRDKTPEGNLLKLGGQAFAKGLFLPAPTKVMYRLDGDYLEFSAVVGVDDQVAGKSPARLIIEGDSKELFTGEFKRSDRRRDLRLNVKDVQQLQITLVPVEPLGFFGCHLDLADAKISK